MAVYSLPKARFIQKVGNFRPISHQWSSKWNIVSRAVGTGRRSSQKSIQDTQGGGLVNANKSSSGDHHHHQHHHKHSKAGGWFTWSGVLLRWTPLGFCLIAAAQWHLHNREMDKKGLPRTATQWQMNVYRSLPLRMVSRCWGWLADCRVPKPCRPIVYGLYSTTFGVKIHEAAVTDYKSYRSLAEFFTRSLRDDVRIIDPISSIVSPCDGRVLHFGSATNEQIEQVKGVNYNLEDFLGPRWNSSEKLNYVDSLKLSANKEDTALYQCIIYLAPGDYHRFHSPSVWQPELRRHFAGELLSVSPKIAKWVPGLFCLNERVVYTGKWKHGFFSFTAVGATNVGSVQIYIDEELKTNRWLGIKPGKDKYKNFDELKLTKEIQLNKGELLGQFNMGSTVVMIFEAPKNFKFNLTTGQTIQLGEPIGNLAENYKESLI
ncbi:phosphatidylserine decarboxylase proenzyme, mitochondrial isoform X2 [Culicoides brevitarsis]|uniref:phosphatidylserine decarboxylase proenzyme, mitochondrial isoform X2 n=1 Tax=Culicoides brevitarsis TaxID=469753 RepID=UPI00307B695A